MGPGDWANWTVAVATIAALALAGWQLRLNGRLAGQTFARQMWTDYLRQGLENPDLGESRIALKALRLKSNTALVSGDTVGSQRYLWFLTIMLDACDNILRYLPERTWTPTVEEQIRFHRGALDVLWPIEARFYSGQLGDIVRRVLGEREI